jgi:hypothetical protein
LHQININNNKKEQVINFKWANLTCDPREFDTIQKWFFFFVRVNKMQILLEKFDSRENKCIMCVD